MLGRPLAEVEAASADLAAIVAGDRPMVVRGLVRDWPAVQAGDALPAYLLGLAQGGEGEVFTGPPEIEGRPFYDADLSGFNFQKTRMTLSALLERIARHADDDRPPMTYMGSAPAPAVLPGFPSANPAPGVIAGMEPRLWIGGPTTIQTHYDLSDNLACVVAGRRAFTLFPPEQAANLYVGPLDFTPAGQPLSLVQFDRPGAAEAFPLFAAAADAALHAVLEPGDALYMPSLWWHHVRSTAPLNMLVNYWWKAAIPGSPSPFDVMVLALAAIRHLPPERRRNWRAFFDHYVFEADETTHAHLPANRRGVLGALSPQLIDRIRRFVVHALTRA